jgi:hypothetical protein
VPFEAEVLRERFVYLMAVFPRSPCFVLSYEDIRGMTLEEFEWYYERKAAMVK